MTTRHPHIATLWALLTFLGLCSCTSDSFKMSVHIDGMGTQNVRVVYVGDEGITDQWVISHNDELKLKGNSEQLTLVTLLDRQQHIIARLVASNGDHVKVNGSMNRPDSIVATGTKVNDNWTKFRLEHLGLYNATQRDELDRSIEQYVKTHPADVLSTILLMADYGALQDYARADSLLAGIKPDAKPSTLIEGYRRMQDAAIKPATQVFSMMLYDKSSRSFETVTYTGHTTFTAFWTRGKERDEGHRVMMQAMKRLHTNGHRVVDVLIDSDTARWHRILTADSAAWHHYWAPGGPTEAELLPLRIERTPLYVVTDTLGHVIYRGSDLKRAEQVMH